MFKQKKRYTSFVVSETLLQVGKLSGNGASFVRFFEVPVPAGYIAEGEVKQAELFTQFLKNVKKQGKVHDSDVVVGIPETKATTHTLYLPHLTEDEIEQAVKREAPSFLPFSYEEEYIDWKIMAKSPEAFRVLVSAVPKQVVEGFAGCFLGAGMHPAAFESTAITLFRLVPKEIRKLVLAAEIGDSSSVMVLGIEGSIEICSVISDNNNLLDKMSRVIQFFAEQKIQGPLPSTMYLCGKHAASFAGQLSASSGMKAAFLKAKLPKLHETRQVEYAALYSLCNKPVSEPSHQGSINILPSGLVEEYRTKNQRKIERVLWMSAILFVLLLLGLTLSTYQVTRNARAALVRRAVPASAKPDASSGLALSFSPAKITLLTQLANENDEYRAVLTVSEEELPSGVTIAGISCEQKKECIISGSAQTRELLLKYKDALDATKKFAPVTIPYSSLEQDVLVDYRLIIPLAKKGGTP